MIGDIFTSIVIILSVFICIGLIRTGGQLQNIQDNWSDYRCNPAIMPVAGSLGPPGTSTSENFSFCLQNAMSSVAPGILQPFAYLQTKTTGMMSGITNSLVAAREQNNNVKTQSVGMFSSIYSMFANILVSFNLIIIKVLAAQGKTSGILTTLLHIMTTVQLTFESMWNGVPGKMIQALSS
jgi:hypothetical protein